MTETMSNQELKMILEKRRREKVVQDNLDERQLHNKLREFRDYSLSASISGNTGEIVVVDLINQPVIIPLQSNCTRLITSFTRKKDTRRGTGEATYTLEGDCPLALNTVDIIDRTALLLNLTVIHNSNFIF